ncbi:MAG: hypothetical protein ACLUIQ_11635 [Dialister invisus]
MACLRGGEPPGADHDGFLGQPAGFTPGHPRADPPSGSLRRHSSTPPPGTQRSRFPIGQWTPLF